MAAFAQLAGWFGKYSENLRRIPGNRPETESPETPLLPRRPPVADRQIGPIPHTGIGDRSA